LPIDWRVIMRTSSWRYIRRMACCLAVLLTMQIAEAAGSSGQDSSGTKAAQGSVSPGVQESVSSVEPKSAGTENASQALPGPNGSDSEPAQSEAASGSSNDATPSGGQEQSGPAKAVGTAAAPAPEVTGVAGSRLTGAAIAPAKQRRVRTFLIRVGVVVGACVAIGTVVALSRSSPSQPRMAH
jgi:hypothetical protein